VSWRTVPTFAAGALATVAPCVVVSNHQSNLDPIVHLATLPLSLRVLAKREMFRIWLLGPAMRTIGMIEVDRDSPDFRRIDLAAARDLAAGHSLLAYPEGTTSADGTIGEFKDGAFVIAVASQVPVLPVERWFVAATLFGARIPARVAERTFGVLAAGLVRLDLAHGRAMASCPGSQARTRLRRSSSG
jgi:1-acyl-sn-glycerol-3-phosphate acyltransferase